MFLDFLKPIIAALSINYDFLLHEYAGNRQVLEWKFSWKNLEVSEIESRTSKSVANGYTTLRSLIIDT